MSSAERTIFSRLSAAAGEAQAYLRRRRMGADPFTRVDFADGRSVRHPPGTERSRALFLAAADLIDRAERESR